MAPMQNIQNTHEEELTEIAVRTDLDLRMVQALAGDRTLNARETDTLNRLRSDRGDSIYSDMLYTLTHRAFPSRQAKHLWEEISMHRYRLKDILHRDPGLSVATHDYLSNVSGLMKNVSVIEESKMSSFANVASRDGLTSLFDQSTFKYRLKEEMERQTRYGGCLSLVMFDIDHFKKVNDTHGHAEGDIILKQVSDILLGQVRSMDTASRYGGEEFAVILPEVDLKSAYIFAERLRQNVENHFKDTQIPLTISLGVASTQQEIEETPDNFIRKTDAQLYEAKRSGRNQVSAGKPA